MISYEIVQIDYSHLGSLHVAWNSQNDYQVGLGLLTGHSDVDIVSVHHLSYPHALLSNYVPMEFVWNCHLKKQIVIQRIVPQGIKPSMNTSLKSNCMRLRIILNLCLDGHQLQESLRRGFTVALLPGDPDDVRVGGALLVTLLLRNRPSVLDGLVGELDLHIVFLGDLLHLRALGAHHSPVILLFYLTVNGDLLDQVLHDPLGLQHVRLLAGDQEGEALVLGPAHLDLASTG